MTPTPPRPAFKPLKPLDDALAQLLAYAQPLARTEQVTTFEADGRVLAQDLVSGLHVPPQDNSAMDGYAVRCADLVAMPVPPLPVSQRIPAGSSGSALAPMTVARIFTGAPIPAGADAVVMQEDCEVHDNASVSINTALQPGQWIRRAGEDVSRGAVVLRKGERLTPASLGLAASVGMNVLAVSARPKVALFSTGDELVMPGTVPPQDMPPGAIYNSNRFFLKALLQRLGCEVSDLGIVPDDRTATTDALRSAAAQHDLILTSGGVSVGEEDHIKPAVQSLGHLDLWQIAIKPGKPFAYGWVGAGAEAGAHFIGLPGNPVSSFVTFLLLVRPFLLKLQGVSQVAIAPVAARADFTWSRADKRREFLRVKRNASGGLDLFPNQSSGVLTSAVWGDGLVDNPPGQTIAPGDVVRFVSFAELLA
ncbi:gephyrin-like molybdotransferase Glp [Rhodoferax sp.]|uniref:molybdopterin molybdotransferase MoeA n=1 Tax=Rhodoferax sp. TaxID=50421 RepID=UPI00262E2553|nr:gephyrin-like molybdotransferase Glp [Rhodoferax sp.]MDD5002098.1 molybdopterin molybdotransferase MoeA [Thiomonas arsenitoxydans]MDD5478185.1 molybdopterin molybdotransferase MoeA [Rhodoferax sp.]